jgi:prolyl-tRNA synthetase
MMQDNKALQASTSHNLGQNFAKAFDLKFQSESGGTEFAWNTSWGASTRMVGGLVMTHGDDKGLRIPPKLAPTEVVIVPIYKSDEERARVLEAANKLVAELGDFALGESRLRMHVDARETIKPGAKYYEWELRGVPVRLELGPRDLDKQQAVVVRRDLGEKRFVPLAGIGEELKRTLKQMQDDMFRAALERREAHSLRGPIMWEKFKEVMAGEGGFVYTGWCGDGDCEAGVKEETKATIRVLPDPEFRTNPAPTECVKCGGPSVAEAVWAKAY